MSNTVVAHLVEPLAGGKEYLYLVGIFPDVNSAVDISLSKLIAANRLGINDYKYIDITVFNKTGQRIKQDYYKIEGSKAVLVPMEAE
jgi:hypothetical protein